MKDLHRLLRESLLHFLLVTASIYALTGCLAPARDSDSDSARVVADLVHAAEVGGLIVAARLH